MDKSKGSKAEAPSVSNFQLITFAHSTPETLKSELELRDSRKKAREALAKEHEDSSQSLKRIVDTADISSDETSSKKSKSLVPTPSRQSGLSTSATSTDLVQLIRNKGGRPSKGSVVKQRTRPTRLNSKKPVKNAPPFDLWCLILEKSPPELLLRLKDGDDALAAELGIPACDPSMFQAILSKKSIWKMSRFATYGEDHPNPPGNLTEYEYADLYCKVGCQSEGCQDKQARAVYWGFLKRWCKSCLKSNTVEESVVALYNCHYPRISKCIVRATFDAWDRYSHAGDSSPEETPEYVNTHHNSHVRYSRSSMTDLIQKAEEIREWQPEKKAEWWQAKIDEANKLLESTQEVEAYYSRQGDDKAVRSRTVRWLRETFFLERASKLEKPVSQKVLNMMPRYHASMAIPNEPHERSWTEFLPKLEEDREEAESFIKLEEECESNPVIATLKTQEYMIWVGKRAKEDTPIQQVIKATATRVILEMEQAIEDGYVADSDIVPLVLRHTFERFNPTEVMQCSFGETCSRTLLMDDARMVFSSVVVPFLKAMEKSGAAKMLKCPGCKRKDSKRLFDFEPLMCHIFEKHAPFVGDFRYFRVPKAYLPENTHFPWLWIKWPKNLPILAKHHVANGKWDPEDDSDYQQEPRVEPPIYTHNAFEGRSVDCNVGSDDFLINILRVCAAFENESIEPRFKTQIALKYALQVHKKNQPGEPVGLGVLSVLQAALLKAGHKKVFENFHCLACYEDELRPRRFTKYVERLQSFVKLREHYVSNHDEALWAEQMFKLPHEGELWEVLHEPGNRKAYEAFNCFFPGEY